MVDHKATLTVDWFVIFGPSKYKKGIMRWIKPDFSHVYAMKKSPGGQFWIVINPLLALLDAEILLVDDYPHPRAYAGQDAVILPIRAVITQKPRWSLCVFNCVEVVKALLGIRSFWTWTPWQLFKYLKKRE